MKLKLYILITAVLAGSLGYSAGSANAAPEVDTQQQKLDFLISELGEDIAEQTSSNWHQCCETLYDHWDTPPIEEGNFPSDFPRYCR